MKFPSFYEKIILECGINNSLLSWKKFLQSFHFYLSIIDMIRKNLIVYHMLPGEDGFTICNFDQWRIEE